VYASSILQLCSGRPDADGIIVMFLSSGGFEYASNIQAGLCLLIYGVYLSIHHGIVFDTVVVQR